MSNTINWGKIYNSSWWGDDANKAAVPCYSAPAGFCSSYNAYLQAVIDAADPGELPTAEWLVKLSTLLNTLDASGVLAKLDQLGVHYRHGSEAFGEYNLLNPSIRAVNSSAAWSDLNGYQGVVASNGHVNLSFAPSVGTKYQQDDACMGVWCTVVSTGSADPLMGGLGVLDRALRCKNAATQRINSSGNNTASIGSNATGAHTLTRTGASAGDLFVGASDTGDVDVASSALPSANFALLRAGNGYGNGSVGGSWVGRGITQSDHNLIASAFTAYQS